MNTHLISMRAQLIRLQVTLAAVVLVICTLAFIGNDIHLFRKSIESKLEGTSNILGESLAAPILFLDKKDADKVVHSLQADPDIVSAYVIDAQGEVFAHYGNSAEDQLNLLNKKYDVQIFKEGSYLLFHRLIKDGDYIGTLFIKSSTQVLVKDYKRYALIVFTVLLAGMIVAVILANLLQASICSPIQRLVNLTKQVAESGDYGIRLDLNLSREMTKEISALSSEFNIMLGQILKRDREIVTMNSELEKKIEERTAQIKSMQEEMIRNAHAAGMAEIAAITLHNIGNIVNSLNVSAEEVHTTIKSLHIEGLQKTSDLLTEKRAHLPEFFSTDSRGVVVVDYLKGLSFNLSKSAGVLEKESKQLTKGVGLIKDVISSQEIYAQGKMYWEEVELIQMVEDILQLNGTALQRHSVQVVKIKREPEIVVKAQKAKLSHILLNLVKNAKEAMIGLPSDKKVLTVEIVQDLQKRSFIKITDTGVGVPLENLKKIFNHGFTTKRTGHGFGLHYCANAMAEMGGNLEVLSDGPGKGTTMTLIFPAGATRSINNAPKSS